jgi:uncharacterized membrane protein
MKTIVKNTKFDNLVNYHCSSNSSDTPSAIVNTSDVNSKANLLKNNVLIEYHILPEDLNKIVEQTAILEGGK